MVSELGSVCWDGEQANRDQGESSLTWAANYGNTRTLRGEKMRDLLSLGGLTDILAGPERFGRSHPGERRRSECQLG